MAPGRDVCPAQGTSLTCSSQWWLIWGEDFAIASAESDVEMYAPAPGSDNSRKSQLGDFGGTTVRNSCSNICQTTEATMQAIKSTSRVDKIMGRVRAVTQATTVVCSKGLGWLCTARVPSCGPLK